jgi:DNA topoisomerase-1
VSHTTLTQKPNEWPPVSTTKLVPQGVEKQKLVPTALGESVLTFCIREFPQLFAYDFTAQMESRLDSVSKGDEHWKTLCRDTWNSYKEEYEKLLKSPSSSSEKGKDLGNGLKAIMTKTGPLLVQEPTTPKSKAIFYSFPDECTIQTITDTIALEHIQNLKTDAHIGLYQGNEILKKKGPFGLYAQCGDLKVPYVEGESLDAIVEKFRLRKESTSSNIKIGPYIFATGQYGPYMYKDLKTKVFVSIPDSLNPKDLTPAKAEELYKKLLEDKKKNQSSGRGRGGSARGRVSGANGRGGRGGGARGGRGGANGRGGSQGGHVTGESV